MIMIIVIVVGALVVCVCGLGIFIFMLQQRKGAARTGGTQRRRHRRDDHACGGDAGGRRTQRRPAGEAAIVAGQAIGTGHPAAGSEALCCHLSAGALHHLSRRPCGFFSLFLFNARSKPSHHKTPPAPTLIITLATGAPFVPLSVIYGPFVSCLVKTITKSARARRSLAMLAFFHPWPRLETFSPSPAPSS